LLPGDREAIKNTVKLKLSTGRYKIINLENLLFQKNFKFFNSFKKCSSTFFIKNFLMKCERKKLLILSMIDFDTYVLKNKKMENGWILRSNEFYSVFNPQVSCSKWIVWKSWWTLKKGFVRNENPRITISVFFFLELLSFGILKLYLVGALKAMEFYFNDEK
jgi:hypothetical protein